MDDAGPCQICREDDNEDVLMYCNECNKLYHTYCVDLQEVPVGHWFCETCRAQREVVYTHPCPPQGSRPSARPLGWRTRAQRRRADNREQVNDESWNQVWRTVWDCLNLDLDFPDDEELTATAIRRHRQRNESHRREHDAWQLRRRIAHLHRPGNRLDITTSSGANHWAPSTTHRGQTQSIRTRHHPGTPEQEPAENRIAWEAFDQARQEESNASKVSPPNHKKRKSVARSPAEHAAARSERHSKRSRTEQSLGSAEASGRSSPSPSMGRHLPKRTPSRAGHSLEAITTDRASSGPSFLQSLLKEVEDSSAPNTSRASSSHRPSPLDALSPVNGYYSPQPTSPALSGSPSTHSSPCALSITPPLPYSRPESPSAPSWRPPCSTSPRDHLNLSSPEPLGNSLHGRKSRLPAGVEVTAHRIQQSSPPPSRSRSNDSSPTRQPMSTHTKHDVQKMVSAALRPHYQRRDISRAEYTMINRDISRQLYDRIDNFEALGIEGRAKWERMAGEEVDRAISQLQVASNGAVKMAADVN